MNHFIGIGRVVGNAELKYTTGNSMPFATFSICINKKWRDKNGERQEKPNYFNCVLWGKYGESMYKLLTKGKQIGINAELEQNTWTDSNGNNHSSVQLNINEIELLASPRGKKGTEAEHQPASSKKTEPGEDDIPF